MNNFLIKLFIHNPEILEDLNSEVSNDESYIKIDVKNNKLLLKGEYVFETEIIINTTYIIELSINNDNVYYSYDFTENDGRFMHDFSSNDFNKCKLLEYNHISDTINYEYYANDEVLVGSRSTNDFFLDINMILSIYFKNNLIYKYLLDLYDIDLPYDIMKIILEFAYYEKSDD